MQSVSSSSNEEQKVFDTLVETPFTTDMVNNIQPYLNVGGSPNQEIVIEGLTPVTMNELNHDTLSPFDFSVPQDTRLNEAMAINRIDFFIY